MQIERWKLAAAVGMAAAAVAALMVANLALGAVLLIGLLLLCPLAMSGVGRRAARRDDGASDRTDPADRRR